MASKLKYVNFIYKMKATKKNDKTKTIEKTLILHPYDLLRPLTTLKLPYFNLSLYA